MSSSHVAFQRCISPACGTTYGVERLVSSHKCGNLLDVSYDWDRASPPPALKYFEDKWTRRHEPASFSGVWRFRELLPFAEPEQIVTVGEGQTLLQQADGLASYAHMDAGCLYLQYEGMNPSGSFKDNGMSAAFTHAHTDRGEASGVCLDRKHQRLARHVLRRNKADARCDLHWLGEDRLREALASPRIRRTHRADRRRLRRRDGTSQEVTEEQGIYLVNSVNPFRLEGQKTIMYRVLEALRWEIPDWIVVPGGNLGNSSSFGKAFTELKELGLISRIPRLAVINASGADTLYELFDRRGVRWEQGNADLRVVCEYYDQLDRENRKASTIASAIEINRPVNLNKCLRALEVCDGVVRRVNDQEILDAKAPVGAAGIGCEPASAASVAGTRLLREEGIIAPAIEWSASSPAIS